MDGESQCVLAKDWDLPTTFRKQIFVHPLMEIKNGPTILKNANQPLTMFKSYKNAQAALATIIYEKMIINISFENGKIYDDRVCIPSGVYSTYYSIINDTIDKNAYQRQIKFT